MSGGSWGYAYDGLDEVAARLSGCEGAERRALGAVLARISKALHDIEWVDSGDYGEGDELPAIREALGQNADVLILAEAIKSAKAERDRLDKAIKAAEQG